MSKAVELAGRKFSRLTVVERVCSTHEGRVQWRCVCECGASSIATGKNLQSGNTKSCGCLQREARSKATQANVKHGMCGTPTYRTWASMLERCNSPKARGYENYGGRGIHVCERWKEFDAFRTDMGDRPCGRTLDRIDVNGNYEPGNCRWATAKQQSRNTRVNRYVNGVTLAELSESTGIGYTTLRARLEKRPGEDPTARPVRNKSSGNAANPVRLPAKQRELI